MGEKSAKQELFTDYSAMLRSLIPDAKGFLFFDRKSRLYWQDDLAKQTELTKEFQIALLQTVKTGELLGEIDRVRIGEDSAFLFQLVSDAGWKLGAIAVLIPHEHDEAWTRAKVHAQIAPGLNSLQRELALRYKLVRTHRKMEEKTSDHRFLRQLGEWSRADINCEDALESILSCCAEHLNSESVTLMVPDMRIVVWAGKPGLDSNEARLMIESFTETQSVSTQPGTRAFKTTFKGCYNAPVLQDKRFPVGVLNVHGEEGDEFEERLNDIADAILSAIEYVLERDFDALTGLPRWPVFESRLHEAWAHDDGQYVMMHFDIDRMQLANDSFGRSFGDQILRKFAETLRTHLNDHSYTRISGNYCAALLHSVPLADAEQLAIKICDAFKGMMPCPGGKDFRTSVSVGVAPLMVTDKGIKDALGPAQAACDAAKDRGRGRVEVYQSADESIVKRLDDIQIIGDVRDALSSNNLALYAQPLASLQAPGKNPVVEILLRTVDEDGNHVSPAQFLSAAERFQVMPDLDRWVVDNTISMLETFLAESSQQPNVAINLSGQSFCNDDFSAFLRDRLTNTTIDAEKVCFEITETVAVANIKQAQAFVNEFKALGCRFSLDDFGTGLSSFAYLKLFPVDVIKIDGNFISDIETNEISRSMVTAIAEIAKVLEIQSVAEYVQNKNSADILRNMGIGWIQGHYVGKPRPLEDYLSSGGSLKIKDCSDTTGASTIQAKPLPDDFLPELALQNMRLQEN